MKKRDAFTLMEIMVVIVIIGLLTGLGVANYHKSNEQAYKKNIFAQLRMMHRGQEWYKVKTKSYYHNPTPVSVADINTALDIYLIPPSGLSYACAIQSADGATYRCTATRKVGAATYYTFSVNQNPLSDTNPSCTAGTKPCP